MKKYRESLLVILALIYGVFAAVFSSKISYVEDYDKIALYATLLVVIFMTFLYSYYYYLKKRFKGAVFFAYTDNDAKIADNLKQSLRIRGYRCLPDVDSYKLGVNIYNQAEHDLNKSKALIVIISDSSKGDKFLYHAIKFMKKRKKMILPITVGDVKVPDSLYGILSTEYDPSSNKTLYLVLEALGESA